MDTESILIIISVLGPVVGFLLGTWIQALYTKKLEHQKHLQELTAQAYADFIKAITQRNYAKQAEDLTRELDALALQIDAKIRISLFASSTIVERLADVERSSGQMSDPEARKAFVALLRAIREERSPKASVQVSDLEPILFGIR